jgi:L-serine dehydratase
MRAAFDFRGRLAEAGLLPRVSRLEGHLYGSLAATGAGHGTPDAVIAGLRGYEPETADPARVHGEWARLAAGGALQVGNVTLTAGDVVFEPRERPHGHPNEMTLTAYADGRLLLAGTYLSIGGGFIRRIGESEGQAGACARDRPPVSTARTMRELLDSLDGRTIAEIAWRDEAVIHGEDAARAGLDAIWASMRACVEHGLRADGALPGALRVPRRAPAAWRALAARGEPGAQAEALAIYAMAVNEENAAGGRVVTAPTNGAAGVLPAVVYCACQPEFDPGQIRVFLLTAAAVGSIIKANASISGAEAGCQAEIGAACAMAAAGLTAIRGGTPQQIENAAEIAIEHHLGMTCDPVGGLVQIPCIERNAVATSKALTASQLALLGDGRHVVALDTAIETMRQTGADMSARYKETSEAGLAVNVVEC